MLLTMHYEQREEAADKHTDPECALQSNERMLMKAVPPNLEALADDDESGEGYAVGEDLFIVTIITEAETKTETF